MWARIQSVPNAALGAVWNGADVVDDGMQLLCERNEGVVGRELQSWATDCGLDAY